MIRSSLAFLVLFGTAQVVGACAKKHTQGSDDVATPTTDAGGGGQTPPPDDDGGGEGAPGQADEPGDKSIDDAPSPYGQNVDASTASIQTKLLDVYCVGCHHGEHAAAGLDLVSLAERLLGHVLDHYEGTLIVPGKPAQSTLAMVIDPAANHATEGVKVMPPVAAGKPAVTKQQVDAVKAFIVALATATATGTSTAVGTSSGTATDLGIGETGTANGSTTDLGTSDGSLADGGTAPTDTSNGTSTDVGLGDGGAEDGNGADGGGDRGDALDPGIEL